MEYAGKSSDTPAAFVSRRKLSHLPKDVQRSIRRESFKREIRAWQTWAGLAGFLCIFVTSLILAHHWFPDFILRDVTGRLAVKGSGLLAAFGLLSLIAGPTRHRIRRQVLCAHSICNGCGYDIRATPDRCPECGAVPAAHAV